MKHPTLLYNIGIAILITVATVILFGVSDSLFSSPITLSTTLQIITALYIFLLLIKSEVKTGKVTLACIILLIVFLTIIMQVDFSKMVYLAIAQIWLTRSLLFYSNFLKAMLDLALCIVSLAVSVWSFSVSNSFIVSIWCFFLTLSLSALFPYQPIRTVSTNKISEQNRFNKAYQSAEMAIRQLARE